MRNAFNANYLTNNNKGKWLFKSWISFIFGIVLLLSFAITFAVNDNNLTSSTSSQSISELVSTLDNGTVKQIASNLGIDLDSPDITGINSPIRPTTDLPWMEINYQWLKSSLTVYVIVDSTNKIEKQDIAAEAIQEWLNLLRTRSSNSTTWNVELHYYNVNNSTVYRTDPPDIILFMYDEHDRRKCAKYYGKADSFHEDNRPQYAKIFTTCGTEHL